MSDQMTVTANYKTQCGGTIYAPCQIISPSLQITRLSTSTDALSHDSSLPTIGRDSQLLSRAMHDSQLQSNGRDSQLQSNAGQLGTLR